MLPLKSHQGVAPALALILAAGIIAASVDRFAGLPEGLRITRGGDGFGSPEIRTGSLSYPRQAVDSDGFVVRMAKPARRIASQHWSIDESLYSIVPPEHVIAVSQAAYERGFSNVYTFAEQYRPAIATDPERVLREAPDLLLVSNSARIDFCDLVRSAGVPIYRAFTMFTTLEQIAGAIRLTGYLTGEENAATRSAERFWSAIRRAQSRRPEHAPRPRILGMGGRYSYGDQTLFHDIVKTLGGINVGAEGGLRGYDSVSSEQIVRWNPEWIVAGADRGATKQVLARLLEDPGIAMTQAARDGRILVFENNVFLPLSPFSVLLVSAIAEAIYV